MRIADADEEIACHHGEGKRSFEPGERIRDGKFGVLLAGAGDQVEDHFAVRRAPENGSPFFKFFLKAGGIREIAVVAEGDNSARVIDENVQPWSIDYGRWQDIRLTWKDDPRRKFRQRDPFRFRCAPSRHQRLRCPRSPGPCVGERTVPDR